MKKQRGCQLREESCLPDGIHPTERMTDEVLVLSSERLEQTSLEQWGYEGEHGITVHYIGSGGGQS